MFLLLTIDKLALRIFHYLQKLLVSTAFTTQNTILQSPHILYLCAVACVIYFSMLYTVYPRETEESQRSVAKYFCLQPQPPVTKRPNFSDLSVRALTAGPDTRTLIHATAYSLALQKQKLETEQKKTQAVFTCLLPVVCGWVFSCSYSFMCVLNCVFTRLQCSGLISLVCLSLSRSSDVLPSTPVAANHNTRL